MADATASGVSPGHEGAAPIVEIIEWGEAGVEAELFADVPVDVLDDLHLEIVGEPLPLGDMSEPPSDDDFLTDVDDEEGDAEAGEAPEEDGAADAGVPPEPVSIDEAIAHCIVAPDGYVTCSVAPWNAMVHIGRISTCPKTQKEFQVKNTSCSCAMHTNCTSPAKVVRSCRQETFLRWLLSGKIIYPVASTGVRKEWGAAHEPCWTGIFAAAPAPSPAT